MSFFNLGFWRLAVTAVILFLFYLAFPNADLESFAVWAILAYALSYLAMPFVKKLFVRRTIAFDMVGVMLKGEMSTDDMKWMPGMRELVQKLGSNYKTALVTNMNALAMEAFEAKFNFQGLFDYVIVSGKVHHAKPSVEIFQTLLDATGSKADNVIFIDDHQELFTGAKQLGIHTIHFKSYDQLVSALREFGVKI